MSRTHRPCPPDGCPGCPPAIREFREEVLRPLRPRQQVFAIGRVVQEATSRIRPSLPRTEGTFLGRTLIQDPEPMLFVLSDVSGKQLWLSLRQGTLKALRRGDWEVLSPPYTVLASGFRGREVYEALVQLLCDFHQSRRASAEALTCLRQACDRLWRVGIVQALRSIRNAPTFGA